VEALDLDIEDPATLRVECFDISHTAGEATQASCVVYENHAMQSAQYRRFNIASAAGGDDYGALREALARRYARLKKGEAPVPDLLLIDGGPGQLQVASEVAAELGIEGLPLLGIAKGPDRNAGRETLQGNEENDTIRGDALAGISIDTIAGGSGNDVFAYSDGGGDGDNAIGGGPVEQMVAQLQGRDAAGVGEGPARAEVEAAKWQWILDSAGTQTFILLRTPTELKKEERQRVEREDQVHEIGRDVIADRIPVLP